MAGTVVTREVPANGQRFLCREAGVGGEPVLLLHGFPETSRMWTRLMSELADAGYHCLAPDQRGYSPGARPAAVDDYSYENLAADVHALAEAAEWDRFHLVAHDWGACAAWAALAANPDPVASFVSMSIPHYRAFAEAAWSDPDGLYRSYLEFFIAPDHLAEDTLAPDDFAALKAEAWTSSSPEEVADYLAVFRQDGALTGALNWYRASRGHRRALDDPPSFEFGPVATPTVLLWGRDDPYALRLSVESAADLMTGEYRVVSSRPGTGWFRTVPRPSGTRSRRGAGRLRHRPRRRRDRARGQPHPRRPRSDRARRTDRDPPRRRRVRLGAAHRLRSLCHAGALRHVRGGDLVRPHPAALLRRRRSQGRRGRNGVRFFASPLPPPARGLWWDQRDRGSPLVAGLFRRETARSVPNPKFARLFSKHLCELRVQRDTRIIELLVSL